MKKLFKFFEYAYLVIGLFFVEELIRTWSDDGTHTILLAVFAVLAFFMFFFRRWFRNKNRS